MKCAPNGSKVICSKPPHQQVRKKEEPKHRPEQARVSGGGQLSVIDRVLSFPQKSNIKAFETESASRRLKLHIYIGVSSATENAGRGVFQPAAGRESSGQGLRTQDQKSPHRKMRMRPATKVATTLSYATSYTAHKSLF